MPSKNRSSVYVDVRLRDMLRNLARERKVPIVRLIEGLVKKEIGERA